jgi:integrase
LQPLMQRARAMGSPFLFPATQTNSAINKKNYTKLIADRQKPGQTPLGGRTPLVDALVLTGGRWTPHDLRRTCATWMVQYCDVSEVVANYCLNHMPSDHMARVYIRAEYGSRMKAAWQRLGEVLQRFPVGTGRQLNAP